MLLLSLILTIVPRELWSIDHGELWTLVGSSAALCLTFTALQFSLLLAFSG